MPKPSPITYFDCEGSENLTEVLKAIKRTVHRRPELQGGKVVFLTAEGRGPALAYNQLEQYDQRIIAVTFSPSFCLKRGESLFHPQIAPKTRKFFQGVEIPILTSRLPFDPVGGLHSEISTRLKILNDTFAVFGGSVPLAIQAVLQACDMGYVDIGETIIAATGDCAIIVSASSSEHMLSSDKGLAVLEFICKPRVFNITRKKILQPNTIEGRVPEQRPQLPAESNKQ